MFVRNNKLITVLNKRSFVPPDIRGLSLWLDANDAATITHAAGAVSRWNDKSGNAYHATQGTGTNQPITNTRTINSKNVLDFDGSNDYMLLPSGLYSIPASDNTLFAVAATDNIATVNQHIFSGANGGAGRHRMLINASTTNNVNYSNSATGVAATKTITTDTNPHIVLGHCATTTGSLYYDGGTATTATTSNVTLTAIRIGSFAGGVTSLLNGIIAEVIIYNSALSTTDLNRVGNYLKSKWGTVWTNV